MRSIPLLFASILTSCEDKTEETGDTDTDTEIVINTNASFTYDCYQDDDLCDLDSYTFSVSDEQFSTYLNDEGQLTEDSCSTLCQEETGVYYDYLCSCDYSGSDEQGMHPVTCEYTVCAVEGRGHGNIQKLSTISGKNERARYFARAYHAEASSVAAFLQLRSELDLHNAPKELLERCSVAANEEVHHARMMAKMAKDCGNELPTLDFGELPHRSLFDLVLDNAIEGCIFESYSALKAHFQAQNAIDSGIRAIMKVIATDETKHAQLAWDIHQYLMSLLSSTEQQQIRIAQQQALKQLITQAGQENSQSCASEFGYPPSKLAETFAQQLNAA
jgi:hypothetical protein